jgi:RHS repeat-associated protein
MSGCCVVLLTPNFSTGQALGRVLNNWQQSLTSPTVNLPYSYDYVGDLLTQSNGVANYTNTYNTAAELTQAYTNYLSSTQSGDLVSGVSYNPLGEPASDLLGNGISESWGYDAIGNPTSYSAGSAYSFSALQWAGHSYLTTSTDSITGRSDYGYDSFGRLATSVCYTGGCTANYSYAYDRYGNRWQQNVTSGTGINALLTFNSQNQVTSNTYDAPGNVTNDGTYTYAYDAENRVTSVNGGSVASYSYDALGRRVWQILPSASYYYTFDLQNNPVSQINASSGTTTSAQIFIGGRHWGFIQSATTEFLHTDWLGTARAYTTLAGGTYATCASLPFGDGNSCTASGTGADFASVLYDAEDNLYKAQMRQLSVSQAHWMHPDPAGLAAVDPTNPQTWNRYAYVGNNPTSFTDPSGLVSMPNVGTYASTGGGGFVSGCTQDGIDSNCLTNLTLVGAGAAGNCPQCTPGNPGGVGQLGTFTPIYGWTYQPGSAQVNTSVSTTITYDGSTIGGGTSPVSTSTIEAPGTYSYGVIGYDTSDLGGDDDLMAQNLPPQGLGSSPQKKQPWPSKTPDSCSAYGQGNLLNFVCKNAGSGRWPNSARGCLQSYWDPLTGTYSMTQGGQGVPWSPLNPGMSFITFFNSHAVCLPGAVFY